MEDAVQRCCCRCSPRSTVLATSPHITHADLRPIGVRIGDSGESLAGVAAWATIADWLCLAYSAEWEAGTGHSEAVEASSAYALTSERALSPFPRFAAPLVMTNLNARLAQVNFRQAFSLPAPMIQSAWQHGILYHLLAWLYSPYLPTRSTLVISANAGSSCSCSWLLHGGMVVRDPPDPRPSPLDPASSIVHRAPSCFPLLEINTLVCLSLL
jgi:hypothetical protein